MRGEQWSVLPQHPYQQSNDIKCNNTTKNLYNPSHPVSPFQCSPHPHDRVPNGARAHPTAPALRRPSFACSRYPIALVPASVMAAAMGDAERCELTPPVMPGSPARGAGSVARSAVPPGLLWPLLSPLSAPEGVAAAAPAPPSGGEDTRAPPAPGPEGGVDGANRSSGGGGEIRICGGPSVGARVHRHGRVDVVRRRTYLVGEVVLVLHAVVSKRSG